MNTISRTYSGYNPGFTADTISRINETSINSDSSYQENNEAADETNNYSKIISGKDQLFTQAEMKLIKELKTIDTEVRQHEMAHIAAGGKYITSAANFTYERGPDGQNYAVSGEVGINTSPIPGDPEATIKKMRQVKSAALAPADPSSQDLKVAANAASEAAKALSELMISQVKNQVTGDKKKAFGIPKKAADAYKRISSMFEDEDPSFKIAV
ncbi:MAG: hypothetical protein A3J80_01415 [Desulfobacula sp. RIFOXYB2_FULL_45_6]|nr:MAG: hypothetical protein A3J80_01415 [Desulfobacula sp. RIFOXYB2_FULL_45_6]